MRDFEALVAAVVILGLVMLFGYMGVYIVVGTGTSTACLASGYANHRITWNLTRYCVNRTDQTDIVVPFAQRAHKP